MKERVFPELPRRLWRNTVKGEKYGIYSGILGGRTDLRPGPDTSGKDKTDAGKGHGASGMYRSGAGKSGDLRQTYRFCRGRRQRTFAGILKYPF